MSSFVSRGVWQTTSQYAPTSPPDVPNLPDIRVKIQLPQMQDSLVISLPCALSHRHLTTQVVRSGATKLTKVWELHGLPHCSVLSFSPDQPVCASASIEALARSSEPPPGPRTFPPLFVTHAGHSIGATGCRDKRTSSTPHFFEMALRPRGACLRRPSKTRRPKGRSTLSIRSDR
jgi:hypothetical protein